LTENSTSLWKQALAPFGPLEHPIQVGQLTIGDGSLSLIAGPCSIETEDLCFLVAEHLTKLCADLGISYIFKASFDKANRTALNSYRGNGMETGLAILAKVKEHFNVPILTDVHETHQVAAVAAVADIVQIPAFLSRQTDLLVECGKLGSAVNIKKGQFMAPDDMGYAAEKVTASGTQNVLTTDRGTSFGYRDLILDLRNLVTMRSLGYPVIFDATHSVQQMGAAGGSSGGLPAFIPAQVRGAVATGVDALFIETHPEPEHGLSDGATMVPLDRMRAVLEMALAAHATHSPNKTSN
jgi:2-dehydro-3-deoxyphosphooctonate aldolase (KDO 8-P synthase)